MKPRALILDIFGDYPDVVGSELKAGELVTLLGVMGVEPATVRMTLSRLKQENWFTTRRVGRETIYRLSDELLGILESGRERIFAPYEDAWDGCWTQVVFQMPETDRTTRDQVKKRLAWLGFGQLTASSWFSPRDLRALARDLPAEFPGTSVDILRCRTDDREADLRLVQRCWDLDALNADYSEFIEAHQDLARKAPGLTGAEALAARTEIVSTYRHFPFRDPSLPVALRPPGWLGAAANTLFLDIHRQLGPAATAYVDFVVDTAGRRDLAPPDRADHQRTVPVNV